MQRLYEIRITETTQRMWITTDTWRPPDPVISFLITANKEWLQYFLWQKKHQLFSAPLLAYLQLVPNWLESHSNLSRTYWKCAQTICLTSALPHCSDNSLLERQTNVTRNSFMSKLIHAQICWLCSAFAKLGTRFIGNFAPTNDDLCPTLSVVWNISASLARGQPNYPSAKDKVVRCT